MSWLFRVLDRGEAAKSVEIAIYDVIGRTFFGEGVGQGDVLAALNAKPKASVLVRVASIGGLLDDAKTMKSLFAERIQAGYGVEFRVESLAASAAAYLLTTPGATVNIAADAFVMIHKARGGMRGTDSDMEAARKLLAEANQVLADAFADASRARGKGKTAADFLAEMANNRDRYFSADEAIAWGLADSKLGAMKVAACAVDLAELTDLPMGLVAQLDLTRPADPEATAPTPPIESPTPEPTPAPAPPVATTEPKPAEPERKPMSDKPTSETNPYAAIVASLGLIAGASETDILARLGRLRDLEVQASAILAVTDSAQLVGAIRGTKAKADTADAAQAELAQVKAERDRQTFDSLIAKGQADRKLTPAEAKFEQEKFDAALAEGRGAHAVAALQGYLAVAPRKFAEPKSPPATTGPSATGALTWNGKAFAELAPMEMHRLKADDPELYAQMRSEHRRQVA